MEEPIDLVARATFDDLSHRLIGASCSALNWERIQEKLGFDVAVGMAQGYFDGTFMGTTVGLETGYTGSLNRNAAAEAHKSIAAMTFVGSSNLIYVLCRGTSSGKGHAHLYECFPIRDLRVIPATNIITRSCLAPCFLDGMSRHTTIPRQFHSWEKRHFEGGLWHTD